MSSKYWFKVGNNINIGTKNMQWKPMTIIHTYIGTVLPHRMHTINKLLLSIETHSVQQ